MMIVYLAWIFDYNYMKNAKKSIQFLKFENIFYRQMPTTIRVKHQSIL
jgi:hypothetical protein